jgi:hypothetical protein
LRSLMIGIVIGFGAIVAVTDAEAASAYCARYVGGKERTTTGAHAHCDFATLEACRASVRERGGGHCYKAGKR